MNRERSYYLAFAMLTIIAGLLLRRLSFVPLATGDFLYAIMVYLWIRVLFVHKTVLFALVLGLAWCYTVEFLQLVQHPYLIAIRATLPGLLILGQGFLWSDLLAYTMGLLLIFMTDRKIIIRKKRG